MAKPSKGTKKDMRLARNKKRKKKTSKFKLFTKKSAKSKSLY